MLASNAEEASMPAEVKRIPVHNPEWTNGKNGDPATQVLQPTKSSEKMMHDTAMSVIRKIGR
jgi:hypothetical protein